MEDLYKQRPTDQAKYFASLAANKAIQGVLNRKGLTQPELADVLHKISASLEEIAVGLRATYMLLEKK